MHCSGLLEGSWLRKRKTQQRTLMPVCCGQTVIGGSSPSPWRWPSPGASSSTSMSSSASASASASPGGRWRSSSSARGDRWRSSRSARCLAPAAWRRTRSTNGWGSSTASTCRSARRRRWRNSSSHCHVPGRVPPSPAESRRCWRTTPCPWTDSLRGCSRAFAMCANLLRGCASRTGRLRSAPETDVRFANAAWPRPTASSACACDSSPPLSSRSRWPATP
mmetsp:Transcript_28000/g.70860  ORF Transcript_28000/g.70860 Transcript_28000/m.70860 type:complete len:221 (+) Transcript_28000:213-875(+)